MVVVAGVGRRGGLARYLAHAVSGLGTISHALAVGPAGHAGAPRPASAAESSPAAASQHPARTQEHAQPHYRCRAGPISSDTSVHDALPCPLRIADPTGVPHVVPGSGATQWYGGPARGRHGQQSPPRPCLQRWSAGLRSMSNGPGSAECYHRCLTYQRSTVSVCPLQDRVNCQQPGDGATISEG